MDKETPEELLEEAAQLLAKVVGIATWMSGSDDFGPGGKAHEGWMSMRDDITRASVFLESIGR